VHHAAHTTRDIYSCIRMSKYTSNHNRHAISNYTSNYNTACNLKPCSVLRIACNRDDKRTHHPVKRDARGLNRTHGVLRVLKGTRGTKGTQGYSISTQGALKGCPGLLFEDSRRTQGVLSRYYPGIGHAQGTRVHPKVL
jgi:hypothetical protein